MPKKGNKDNKVVKATLTLPDGVGLREWAHKIEDAWYEETENDLRYSHVREVFSDHVIVATGYGSSATTYKVPYVANDDGVSFDQDNMNKVELKIEWVEKAHKFSNPTVVKSLGDDRIGAYAILWGDEENLDIHGEYFNKDTQDLLNVFNALGAIPWLFHHGGEETIKSTVIGVIDTMEPDDVGLWYETKITEQDMYKNYVERFVKDGRLFSSSGTFPAAKEAGENGYIARWPIAEVSGTWVPAEYRMILNEHSIDEVKAYYKSIGINNLDEISEDFAEPKDESSTDIPESDVEDTDDGADVEAQKLELAKLELDFEKLELDLVNL